MSVPFLLVDVLEQAATRAADGLALTHGRRTVTYDELEGNSSALAFALERRGVAPGDRVAMLLDSAESLVTFWAIAKVGAVGVLLDADDVDELAAVLRELDARALVVDASIAPTFHHAVARVPHLRVVIVRGRRAESEATGSAVYVSYENALADEDPLSSPSPRRIDLDDAWLEPDDDGHWCALSHRVLISRGSTLVRGLALDARDALAGPAFAEIAVACAIAGASFRIAAALGEAGENGRSLFIVDDRSDDSPPTGSTAIELFGATEFGPVAVLNASNEPAHVLPNVDVRIVDDAGLSVAAKVVGEIAVRSSNLASPATLAAKEGYFATGAAGMLDDAGALYVL